MWTANKASSTTSVTILVKVTFSLLELALPSIAISSKVWPRQVWVSRSLLVRNQKQQQLQTSSGSTFRLRFLPTFKFGRRGSTLTTYTRFIFRIYWHNDR